MLFSIQFSKNGIKTDKTHFITIGIASAEVAKASILGKYSIVVFDEKGKRIASNILGAPVEDAFITDNEEMKQIIIRCQIQQLMWKSQGHKNWSCLPPPNLPI